MHEVETIADNEKGKLVDKLGLLEKVLDLLGVVEIALSANALDLTDLSSTSSGLNILEVDFGVLAEVDDRTEIIVKAYGV